MRAPSGARKPLHFSVSLVYSYNRFASIQSALVTSENDFDFLRVSDIMASQSPEWIAMVECHVKLTNSLASDILNISGLLFAKKIISSETREKMLLSSITAMEKASFLVGAVSSVTEGSPQKFRDFIEVLSGEPMTEDVAKMLTSSYESHQNRDLKIEENKDSTEYSLVFRMSQVIISAVAQNSLMIAEDVSKEALIPADIMDRILTVDYTPLQRAEILFTALMEKIEKDSEVLYKFLAILSNFEQNRPLVITLKGFLPSTKVKKSNDEWIGDAHIKLMKAVQGNDVEYVRHLLKLGVVDVNQFITLDPNVTPCTALDAACLIGCDEVVKVLIEEFGADVNIIGDTGAMPLSMACRMGHVEIVKILLKHGAKVDMGLESVGVSPLMEAAYSGDVEIAKILLENGALKGSSYFHQYTPLAEACASGYIEIAKMFLEAGAPVNVIANDGAFSLLHACKFGHADIVELLLLHGAHIDLQNSDGNTALIAACEMGCTKAVKVLLEHGANTSLIAKNGNFALERACYGGYRAIVKLLIKHNAFINMANKRGVTALICASIRGHFSVVQMLLKAGADKKMKSRDAHRNKAVDFAKIAGHDQIVNLLLGRPTIKESFITLLPLAAKWKTIGFLLDLDDQLLDINNCLTNEEALRMVLLIWLGIDDPEPSWEVLAEAIEPIDESIAEKIISLCN